MPCRAQNIQARAQNAQVGFVRWPIDDFVAALAVECPSLGFRDVVDAPQAGYNPGRGGPFSSLLVLVNKAKKFQIK